MPVVTSFFLSDFGKWRFIPFAIKTEAMKRIIIKAIDDHLRSSPSIESKMKVADVPAITASPILNQKRLSNLRLV